MSSKMMEKLKNAFKNSNEDSSRRSSNYYPFWNAPEGSQAIVRFLPDKNADNPRQFLVEKSMHVLNINGESKSVPCLKMYGEDCPICNVSRAFYKEGDKDKGKQYYVKRQYIGQVLVVKDPIPADEETGENSEGKVKLITLGYQLYNLIKDAFDSDELEEPPYLFEGGTNFIIKKTKQGEYATYAVGSKFARAPNDLTEEEIAVALEGSVDLATVLPQSPGYEKVQLMLEAALTGGEYEGHHEDNDEPPRPIKKPAATKKPIVEDDDDEDDEDEDEIPVKSSSKKETKKPTKTTESEEDDDEVDEEADRILEQIRARRAKKG